MKTNEELNALREEIRNVGSKIRELSEDELNIVSGGDHLDNLIVIGGVIFMAVNPNDVVAMKKRDLTGTVPSVSADVLEIYDAASGK